MIDPYVELGVDRKATPAEVKRAYRKKAAKSHPDKPGGSTEKFQRLQKSYDVLSDARRRADYDKNGRIDEGVQSIETQAMQMLGQMVVQFIDQLQDVKSQSILDAMRSALSDILKNNQRALATVKTSIEKRKEVRSRLKSKTSTMMIDMIDADIAQREQQIVSGNEKQEVVQLAIDMLKDYEYEVEKISSPAQGLFGMPTERFMQFGR